MSQLRDNTSVPVESLDVVKQEYQSSHHSTGTGSSPPSSQDINAERQARWAPHSEPASATRVTSNAPSFNCQKVDTWGMYIEVDSQETTREELYKKLRAELNLHETKGLRCLLLDCVVVWEERSQAYFAAGKDWKVEGNVFQGQLLLDTLYDTISEFVSRLGPYQVFQNQEKKREHLRPPEYPLWRRTPQNSPNMSHADASAREGKLVVSEAPEVRRLPCTSRRRRMADLAPQAGQKPLTH